MKIHKQIIHFDNPAALCKRWEHVPSEFLTEDDDKVTCKRCKPQPVKKSGMELATAESLAREYTKHRKEIRTALIEEARRLVDQIIHRERGNDERKLYKYPSDLSDERILRIIDSSRQKGAA